MSDEVAHAHRSEMSRFPIPRQKSLVAPEVVNPFVHSLELTWLDKLQFLVMTITVVPLRLFMIISCLMLAWGLARLALWGRTKEEETEPMKGWRKCFIRPLAAIGRWAFFGVGFHSIREVGRRANSKEAPVLIVAPHSTFFDSVIMFLAGLPSSVSRIENGRVPLLGTLTRFTQPVFVSREDPDSRVNTIKEITRRAQSGGAWPQVIIFPEGTCTNRSCLISFKPGAFYPGVPVQPVLFRYGNKLDTYTWTWEGIGAFKCLWYSMCQFHNTLEIEYLPVYTPNEEEKKDAKLFARNVRAVMAKALGVPETDHTYEDIRLMNYAAKLELPAAAGLVEFAKINRKLGMNFDNMQSLLEKFCKMAQSSHGQLTVAEFSSYLGVPVSEALQTMFNMYDRDGSGTVDFREYVIGLSLVAMPANNEETIQLAFQVFDSGDKGYINSAEFALILDKAFGMNSADSRRIFNQVDSDHDDRINYADFKAYAELRPEYAKLFHTYTELQSDNHNGTLLTCDLQDNGLSVMGSELLCCESRRDSIQGSFASEPHYQQKVKSA